MRANEWQIGWVKSIEADGSFLVRDEELRCVGEPFGAKDLNPHVLVSLVKELLTLDVLGIDKLASFYKSAICYALIVDTQDDSTYQMCIKLLEVAKAILDSLTQQKNVDFLTQQEAVARGFFDNAFMKCFFDGLETDHQLRNLNENTQPIPLRSLAVINLTDSLMKIHDRLDSKSQTQIKEFGFEVPTFGFAIIEAFKIVNEGDSFKTMSKDIIVDLMAQKYPNEVKDLSR